MMVKRSESAIQVDAESTVAQMARIRKKNTGAAATGDGAAERGVEVHVRMIHRWQKRLNECKK